MIKKQIIHISSLSSLFLAGIVIGNSCNAINRSKADNGEPPLVGSLEQQDSGIPTSSRVDTNQIYAQHAQNFLNILVSGPKGERFMLEKTDFYKRELKNYFYALLTSSSLKNYSSSVRYRVQDCFFDLIKGNIKIKKEQYKRFCMSIHELAKYNNDLDTTYKKMCTICKHPAEPEHYLNEFTRLKKEFKNESARLKMLRKDVFNLNKIDKYYYYVIVSKTVDTRIDLALKSALDDLKSATGDLSELFDQCESMLHGIVKKTKKRRIKNQN